MSRILRRPMFRGGRVDARGTGITSNLGYQSGGRVGYKNAGAVTGGQISEEALAKIMGQRGTLLGDVNRGLTKGTDFLYNTIARPLGNLPYMASDYVFGTEYGEPIENKNSFEEWIEAFGGADKILGADRVTGVDLPPGGGETKLGSEEAFYEAPEKPKDKSLEEIMKEMMGPQKTAKEKVAEYKEVFKDAYGSGVPEDASRMLMSAASRLLEPEATVKSGLGKFLGDESKVESKRVKYKDAATTAAINAYLTGEKDYDSMMKQMKMIDYQIDKKYDQATKTAKAESIISRINQDKSSGRTKGDKLKMHTMEWVEDNPQRAKGVPQLATTKEINNPKLLIQENVGVVFIDDKTNEVWIVEEIENDIVLNPLVPGL